MNLVRFKPMREMDLFSDRMNDIFGTTFFPRLGVKDESGIGNWTPAVDIFEKNGKTTIKAELPGVDKKDVNVDVKEGVLTLSGERSYENEVKEENFYKKERAYGRFNRSFSLPEGLDPDMINAEFKDGILTIEMPQSKEKEPKKISVN